MITLAGIPWMKYRGALIPAAAMPHHVEVSREDALCALRKSRTLFLRFTSESEQVDTNWWHMVCRSYDFMAVSSNTRSKIRRGLKRLEIEQVRPSWLAESGYDCHVKCYERYSHASPRSCEDFGRFLSGLEVSELFETWTCARGGELLGYVICLREDDGVFLHTIDITPEGLRAYGAYAMIHRLLEHYVNDLGLPVSNGSRSIAHATEMQDFLRKLGFAREHCNLHVIYHPAAEPLVKLLYPFRRIVERLQRIPLVHSITSVLHQEELCRQHRDP